MCELDVVGDGRCLTSGKISSQPLSVAQSGTQHKFELQAFEVIVNT